MTATTFDELRKRPAGRPKSTCPRCGERDTAGMIRTDLQHKHSNGAGAKRDCIASRARSFCEPCSVAVYAAIVNELEGTL
jgi:hypothetical protein